MEKVHPAKGYTEPLERSKGWTSTDLNIEPSDGNTYQDQHGIPQWLETPVRGHVPCHWLSGPFPGSLVATGFSHDALFSHLFRSDITRAKFHSILLETQRS
jgi:hypothetical protein